MNKQTLYTPFTYPDEAPNYSFNGNEYVNTNGYVNNNSYFFNGNEYVLPADYVPPMIATMTQDQFQAYVTMHLMNKSYMHALNFLKRNNIKYRVVAIDNYGFITTSDYNDNRVNLTLQSPYGFTQNSRYNVTSFLNRYPQHLSVSRIDFG